MSARRKSRATHTRPAASANGRQHTLVTTSRARQLAAGLTLCLAAGLLCAATGAHAKTHHSKRQAAGPLAAQSSGPGQQTGRENTNWWNLWWQQYIDEAAQPTVRPIVAVSLAGHTIRAPDEQRPLDEAPPLDGGEPNSLAAGLDQADIERTETLRPVASSQPSRRAAKWAQHQANSWQAPAPGQARARDARLLRQAHASADQQHQWSDEPAAGFGIQMRAAMPARRPAQIDKAGVAQPARPLVAPASNLLLQAGQQQAAQPGQPDDSGRFEQQQQHQMSDDAEEAELEAGPQLAGAEPDQQPAGRPAADSSSSSMMMAEPARRQPVAAAAGGGQPTTTSAAGLSEPETTGGPGAGAQASMARPKASQTTPAPSFAPTQGAGEPAETPIALGGRQQEPGAKTGAPQLASTTASSRVELENGRPAGGARQQAAAGTTTSSRLPTPPATQAPGSGAAAGQPAPSGAPSTPPPATTTTLAATTAPPATASPSAATTRQQPGAPAPTMSSQGAKAQPANATTGDEGAPEESDEESDDDEPADAGGLLNATGAEPSGTDEPAGDDTDEPEEDLTTGGEQEPGAATTSKSPPGDTGANRAPSSTTPQTTVSAGSTASRAGGAATTVASVTGPTTQQPVATTTDIERLPKGGQTTGSGAPLDQTGAPMVASSKQPARDDLGRLMAAQQELGAGDSGSRSQQQQQRPSVLMMSVDTTRADLAGETAITVPMEAIMKMMMLNQINDERQQQQTSTAQERTGASQADGQQPSGTTASLPAQTGPTSGPSTTTETPAEQTTASSGAPIDGANAPDTSMNVVTNGQQMRKKLQPPPTTRLPSGQASVAQQARADLSTVGPAQEQRPTARPGPASGAEEDNGAAFMSPTSTDDGSGGREPKIELLNMDLVPIQRIMSGADQPALAQQQQPKFVMNQIGQSDSGAQTTGGALGPQKQPQAVPEVEPGMRLRPPTGSMGPAAAAPAATMAGQMLRQPQQPMPTARPQVPQMLPSGFTMPNQANTVYMIMMNGPQQQSAGTMASAQPASEPAGPTGGPTTTTVSMVAPQHQAGQPKQTQMQTRAPAGATGPARQTTTTQRQQQHQPMSTTRSMGSSTVAPKQTGDVGSGQQQSTGQGQNVAPTPIGTTQLQMATIGQQQQMRAQPVQVVESTTTATTAITTGRPRFANQTMDSDRSQPVGAGETMTTTKAASTNQADRSATSVVAGAPATGTTTSGGGQDQSTTSRLMTTTGSPVEREQSITSSRTPFGVASATTRQQAAGDRDRDTATTTTTAATSTSAASQQQQQQQMDATLATQRQVGSTGAPPTSAGAPSDQLGGGGGGSGGGSGSGGGGGGQAKRPQQQQPPVAGGQETRRPQQQHQAATKTSLLPSKTSSGTKAASGTNLTSSFIPSKLRDDFNQFNRLHQTAAGSQPRLGQLRQQEQTSGEPTTTRPPLNQDNATTPRGAPLTPTSTPSPMVQSMAIRQFGGANRMSALANGQPVPFGRPATMVMGPAAARTKSQQQAARHELPTFEYGPSIAVRRPDEPLANGQIPNCTLTGKNFCVLTKDYPMNEVRQAVERSFRSVRIMYEELQTVSDQELHKDDYANATNNQAASGKFACQTQVEMMRPGWAKDEITKEWMLVVNTDVFPQRVRTESCAQPNTPCEFIAPFYDSTCQQRYSLHRMIAIDPHDPSRSPQVAVFKFPAGCVCRVHPVRKNSIQVR